MLDQKLLQIIERLKSEKPYLFKDTELYPNVNEEYIGLVKNDFPEYDQNQEIPLLFYKDLEVAGYENNWLCLTNKRLYYKISYFPPVLIAMDCIPLRKIHSFKMRTIWVSHTLYINGQKTGNITQTYHAAKFIKKYIQTILDNVEDNDAEAVEDKPYVINYYPEKDWRHLENASLFPLVHEYFTEHNQAGRRWGFAHFYTNPFIKPESMEYVRKVYADYDPEEEIPLLFVENGTKITFTKTDKDLTSGIVITNKYIYYKLQPTAAMATKDAEVNKMALSGLKSFTIKSRFFGWVYINGKKGLTNAFDILDSRGARVFEKLMNLIIAEIKKNTMKETSGATPVLDQKLSRVIKQLQSNKTFFRNTILYTDIGKETTGMVKNNFPEYEPDNEVPLLFSKGNAETVNARWIFITDQRLYYRLGRYPAVLTSSGCVKLTKIKSFKIRNWLVINDIYLNGVKIGRLNSFYKDAMFLKKAFKLILKNLEPEK
ncbi:MAG: hypothetical protein LBR98_07675 [Syntrophomonadaceae bacterium]|jgi:hypothetical protein|nr:hypothetical protein [Syntrophomonadaceae bacterium]